MRDFTDPPLEKMQLLLVDDRLIAKLETLIDGCEQCDEEAEFPFDWIIDSLMGRDSRVTDYLMERQAKCPNCYSPLMVKTLVSW